VDSDDTMESNCMPFQHPQGPVSEWPQKFQDAVDNCPFILCCGEGPVNAVFWILQPRPGEFS